MLRLSKSIEMIVVLFAFGIAWSVSAADKESPAAKPALPKLKQKAAAEPTAKNAEKKADEAADTFVVPDGTAKELVEYVSKLIATPPRDADAKKKMRNAILKAAEKILAAKPDQEDIDFAVEAKMNMLDSADQLADFAAKLQRDGLEKSARQVRGFMLQIELGKTVASDRKQIKKAIAEVIEFLDEAPPQPSDIRLAFMVGRLSEMAKDNQLAVETYAALAKAFAGSKDPTMADFAKLIEGVGRRLNLVGQDVKIEGKLLDGEEFDWSKYAGKVVLIDFWATGYPTSIHEIPDLKGCYELFHNRGLEIIGVSLDRDRAAVETFVKDRAIPWTIVTGDGKPSPTVVYYGVISLPTRILVGKDGKAISLNASGEPLKMEIEKLLPPLDEASGKEEKKEEK